MSFERKVERTRLKKQFKKHNKGIEKRYRTKFKDFWAWYQKKKRGDK